MPEALLPTVVIGGYLGAGKTTLVNHLLRQAAGRRIAVLVNDFGELNIDADLIIGAEGAVIDLAGGCICCAFGADLVGALQALGQRETLPDQVLIEASGVALPRAVARTASLCATVDVQAVVVLADAQDVRQRATDRYVGELVTQQLQQADLLLLNKVDELDAAQQQALLHWLDEQAPQAAAVCCSEALVPSELVLGWAAQPAASAPAQRPDRPHEQREGMEQRAVQRWATGVAVSTRSAEVTQFSSQTLQLEPLTDAQALAVEIAARPVLRAKGFVQDARGQAWLIQVVGSRWRVSAATQVPAQHLNRLVIITARKMASGL